MILNTGDVPNLYPADEKAEIIEKMQTVAKNEVNTFTTTKFTIISIWFVSRFLVLTLMDWSLYEKADYLKIRNRSQKGTIFTLKICEFWLKDI